VQFVWRRSGAPVLESCCLAVAGNMHTGRAYLQRYRYVRTYLNETTTSGKSPMSPPLQGRGGGGTRRTCYTDRVPASPGSVQSHTPTSKAAQDPRARSAVLTAVGTQTTSHIGKIYYSVNCYSTG